MRRVILRSFFKVYFWLAERLYHELAWAYDPVSWLVSAGYWDRWRKLAMVEPLGGRVLEIGFGTGELQIEMAKRQVEVYGLERSWAMQQIVRRKASKAGASLRCSQGESQHLPYPDGCFDTVIATFPAGYIGDPLTWQEVGRCLRKPGGRFIVSGLYVMRFKKPLPTEETIPYEPHDGELLNEMRKLALRASLDFQVMVKRYGAVGVPVIACQAIQGDIDAATTL